MQAMQFIDSRVEDAATLVRDLPSDSGMVMLLAGADGLMATQAQAGCI